MDLCQKFIFIAHVSLIVCLSINTTHAMNFYKVEAEANSLESRLYYAALNRDVSLIQKALQANPKLVYARSQIFKNNTLLHAAALGGCSLLIAVLIHYGANVNALNNLRQTPLALAAITRGGLASMKELLDAGAYSNTVDNWGRTPLMGSTYKRLYDSIELLVARGADLNYRDNEGKTAIDIAIKFEFQEIMYFYNANINLHYFIYTEDIKRAIAALDSGAQINSIINGKTVLHRAASCGNEVIVKLLLNHGASDEIIDSSGYTPLQVAQNFRVLQALLVHRQVRQRKAGHIFSYFSC